MATPDRRSGVAGAFKGFSPEVFTFFDGLGAHQSRDWFLAHKDAYEQDVRVPMAALVTSLSVAFAAQDIPLAGDAKRSLFRINRDVRFSKDKRPYKTNASAILSRDGSKTANGVLYFHLDGPERAVFVAAGFYGPDPADLSQLRDALAHNPAKAEALQEVLANADLTLSREGALMRMPKGYESFSADGIAQTLKLKNLIVRRSLAISRLYDGRLVDEIVTFAQDALPLLEFGWNALAR